MAGRVRPSGSANVPSPEEREQASKACADAVAILNDAMDAVVVTLGRIVNPVERAKAALEVRRFSGAEVTGATDGLFRDAVIEAYTAGRAEHGWYGYGALAEELGLSRARVQQVVSGTWKKADKPDSARVASLRAAADQTRTVRRLAGAGHDPATIAQETGLSVEAVSDLLA